MILTLRSPSVILPQMILTRSFSLNNPPGMGGGPMMFPGFPMMNPAMMNNFTMNGMKAQV